MKKVVLSAFVSIIIISCSISIAGVTNDYSKLTPEQKNLIVELNDFESIKPGLIYKINGIQLKQELKKHPKSIVYVFKNGCTAKACKPLMVFENYAKEHNYKLFFVMNGYANLDKTLEQPYSSILFSINNDYYKSNNRNDYIRYFENEISNKQMNEESKEYLGNLYFFEKDTLVKVVKELPHSDVFLKN